ncbi:MAG: PA2169 family four-helix-bundle protein [Sphingobacteriales bacterium]|nr:MAG: PA2169 family four-helix-bundle protein [Sphingobacteriales bacterium]
MENKSLEILNDLVLINNDRINGYEKALKELKDEDEDLKYLFLEMIDESRNYKMTLATEIIAGGEDAESGTTNSGKIYRMWMDVKAMFSGHDREAILSNCEFGEQAAQNAYKMALDHDNLPAYLRVMIEEQKYELNASLKQIKALSASDN